MPRLALLALLLPSLAFAQEVKLPAEVRGAVGSFVVIEATTTDPLVKWFGVDPGLNVFPPQLLRDSKMAVVTAMTPGRYRVLAVSAKADKPSEFAQCVVVIGDAPPLPPPIPPGPIPNPPLPPVPAGVRWITVLRESSAQTSPLADTLRDLRNPTTAAYQYLKSKGHSLIIIDPDQKDFSGVSLLDKWRPTIAGMTLPIIVISDGGTNVFSKTAISATTPPTADAVIELVRKAGG